MIIKAKPSNKKKPRSKPKKTPSMFSKITKLLSLLLVLLAIVAGGLYIYVFHYLAQQNPDGQFDKKNIIAGLSSETLVFYNDGESLLGSLFDENHRRYITYDQIPNKLIEAVVAGEDKGFFNHGGVDFIGIARAMATNILKGRSLQGGSTLTQQTAKNIFGRPGRTLKAKLNELVQALRLENHFKKEEILEFYLNQFFVVGTGRGVGIAAEYFFDRPLKELNDKECAFIAASLKGPFNYDPFGQKDSLSLERALKKGEDRIAYILDKMEEQKYLTSAQNHKIRKQKLRFKKGQFISSQGTLMQAVLKELSTEEFQKLQVEKNGEEWKNMGLRIVTTIDKDLQKHIEEKFKEHLDTLKTYLEQRPEGAVVLLDSNKIIAYVGGYHNRGYDRVSSAKRQFGSTWKTPLISLALEEGYELSDLIENENNVIRSHRQFYYPQADHKHRGAEVSVQWALTKSENIASIRLLVELLDKADNKRIKALAKKYDLAQRSDEGGFDYRKRLRDEWDIPIDEIASKEIQFEKAKEKLRTDWVLGGKENSLRYLKSIEYGRGYEEQIKKVRSKETKAHLALNYLSLKSLSEKYRSNPESLTSKEFDNGFFISDMSLEVPPKTLEDSVEIEEPLKPYLYGYFTPKEFDELEQKIAETSLPKGDWWTNKDLYYLKDFRTRLALEHFRHSLKEWGLNEAPSGYLSLPLGSIEVTLIELSQVYANLTNEKIANQDRARLIQKVLDDQGGELYELKESNDKNSSKSKLKLSLALKSVVDNGTGTRANVLTIRSPSEVALKYGVGGKTGTTNSFKNTSFIGIIPKIKNGYLDPLDNYTLGVYVGFDNNKALVSKSKAFSGASASLPVWVDIAEELVNKEQKKSKVDFLNLEHQLSGELTWKSKEKIQQVEVDELMGNPSVDSKTLMWTLE